MLRRLIKAIIPAKGEVFFTLFMEAGEVANESAQLFFELLSAQGQTKIDDIYLNLRSLKHRSNNTHKVTLQQLNNMFITPIDRGDIQELSNLLNILTKKIIKVAHKLNIYKIEAELDSCLIKNANTLVKINQTLLACLEGLKTFDMEKVSNANEQVNTLEENGIEDFRYAIDEMYSGKFDTLTILKLKEIYKSIDGVIETAVNAANLVTQVVFKSI